MKNLKIIFALFLGLLLAHPVIAQVDSSYIESIAAEIAGAELTLLKIQENNYYIISSEMGGNIAVYVGEEGICLVDNQWAVLVPRIKEMLMSISQKPVNRIINTHYHFDHTDGNKIFGNDGVPVIAHINVLKRLSADQILSPPFHILQKAYPTEALPTTTFDNTRSIFYKQEVIELRHYANAHTDGDVVVHFKNADIYHTGDIFVTYGLPYIDEQSGGDIYAMIEAIEDLISVSGPETRFIPGHGPLCTLEDLKAYHKLLVSVRDQVAICVKEGLGVEDTLDRVEIDPDKEGISKEHSIRHVYRMVQKHN